MPDFERVFRRLEIEAAATPEEKAYAAGVHAGMDKARWQVARWVAFFVLGVLLYQVAQHAL